MAKRQSFLPGFGYIVEEGDEESFLPGYGYVKEDQADTGVTLPIFFYHYQQMRSN